jgi:hypothetical protein
MGWQHVDITQDSFGGSLPTVKSAIAGYSRAGDQHVVFLATNGDLHVLWYDGSWNHVNLTQSRFGGSLPVAVKGAIAAYARGTFSQHLVYHGVDDKIHMLIYDINQWRSVNLTDTFPPGSLPAVKDAIVAYMSKDTQHVVYHGVDDHIHEFHLYIESDSGGLLESIGDAVSDTVSYGADTIANWGETLGDLIPEPIRDGIETVFNWANTIAGGIITTIAGLLSPITSFVGAIIGIISAIPVIGRFVKWVYEVVTTVTVFVLNIPDFILTLLGIMPIKKMRVYVLVQKSQAGPVAEPKNVEDVIRLARKIFFEEARVKILPVGPFHYSDSISAPGSSLSSYWKVLSYPSDTDTLDVCCGSCALGNDLVVVGSKFEVMMTSESFWGNSGRAISIGAPVVAFTVRSFSDGKQGCSLGPLTDYVTILLKRDDLDSSVLAHELGHACNLLHVSNSNNLMYKDPSRGYALTVWQKMLLRASRHVTWW